MDFIVAFAFIALLARAIMSASKSGGSPAAETGGSTAPLEPAHAIPTSVPLPWHRRMVAWYRLRKARARSVGGYEYDFDSDGAAKYVEVQFYAPRKVLKITVLVIEGPTYIVDECQCQVDKEWQSVDYGIVYTAHPNKTTTIEIFLSRPSVTDRIRIGVVTVPENIRYRVNLDVAKDTYPDEQIVDRADTRMAQQDTGGVVSALQEYLKNWPHNPHIMMVLARWLQKQGDFDKAEIYALKSWQRVQGDAGLELYRSIQAERQFLDIKEVRGLQEASRDWQPGGHHGAVALLEDRRYHFGLDGWYIRKVHDVLEVRREAAARFLTRYDFRFTNRQRILHSDMRIIHSDDSIEMLGTDRLTIGDSHDRNVFIEDEVSKLATWLLPDLAVGDVIECTFHILVPHEQTSEGRPRLFVPLPLFHTVFPTFQGHAEFSVPASWDFRCVSKNGAPSLTTELIEENTLAVHRCQGERFVPLDATGYPYDTFLWEPYLACSCGATSWKDVSEMFMKRNIGDCQLDETLPTPLANILSLETDPLRAMERTFYFVRDKIKYGSFVAARKLIGNTGRLEAVVSSGVGDCRDKAYALAQIARKLGLEFQFLAISTDRGLLVEELPVDQFDHVFVRVRNGSEWYYLDATDSLGGFGLPPGYLQGIKVLVGNDGEGTIVSLPEDDPDRNGTDIVETFESLDEDYLSGTFSLSGTGRTGRKLDEHWKAWSLRKADPIAAAAEAMTVYLPSIQLERITKTSNTAVSDLLAASGSYRRTRWARLGDRLVGTIVWNDPAIPFETMRHSGRAKRCLIDVPHTMHMTVHLRGPLLERLKDYSSVGNLSNPICEVTSNVTKEVGSLTLHRSIVLKKRVIDADDLEHLPKSLACLEQALRLSLALER